MRKRSFLLLLLVLIVTLLPPGPAAGAVPTVDGFNSYSSAISGTGIRALALQPWDGKILVGGDFTISHGTLAVARQHLARLNTDGTIDTGFTPTLDGPVHSIVIQPDAGDPSQSLILIGGSFTSVSTGGAAQARKGLARLRSSDGLLDGFDPVTTTENVTINAMALRPDGQGILVGGRFAEIKAGWANPNLAGIALSGAGQGEVNWSCSGGVVDAAGNEVNAILLQGGQVLAGGTFATSGASDIARFNSDGSFDDQFNPPSPGGKVRALALQPDGKVLVGGDFPGGLLLRRLNRDGTLDASFNPLFNAGGGVASIQVQPDGKILVAGEFTLPGVPGPRDNLARLNIDGTLEPTVFHNLDAAVHAVLRQPDGRVLAAGDFTTAGKDPITEVARPSPRLARFYPHGTLDHDIPVDADFLDWEVQAVSVSPSGLLTMGGLFELIRGEFRLHFARLTEDWLLDQTFNPDFMIFASVYALVALPDDGVLVGGNFSWPYNTIVRLDPNGYPDGGAENPQTTLFNDNLNPLVDPAGTTQAIALLPPGTPLPDGTESDQGMMYVSTQFLEDPSFQSLFLARIKSDGSRDASFQPAAVTEKVTGLALQPDGKVVVATDNGKVMRLLSTGALDPAWRGGTPLQINGQVTSLVLQPDGRVVASGRFSESYTGTDPLTGNPVTWERNLVRIGADGTIDNSFNIQVNYTDPDYTRSVIGATLQTDGNLLIFGVFNRVKDGKGVVHVRDSVARIRPNGDLDTGFDLGPFIYHSGPISNVQTVRLLEGKMIVAGNFYQLNGKATPKLARLANGWASQELSVSASGSTITWLRSGTGPELGRVTFEYCENPDVPDPVWTHLGNGQRIAGGWQLNGVNLAQYGLEANRYVRARGYTAGDKGGAGALVESVRLYYLEEVTQAVLTVAATARSKTYGDDDPALTYSASGFVNGDTSAILTGSLARVAGENVGSYAIGLGTLSAGPNYTIVFTGAQLTINAAPLSVTAAAKSKTYGVLPDPALTYSVAGLVNGDTDAVLSGGLARAGGENVGSYAIGQGTLSAGANYSIAYTGADLVIDPASLAVSADAQSKVYGTMPDPQLTFSVSGLVNGDTVAILSGGLVRAGGENVGSYAIGQGTLGAGANYTIAFTGATLSIAPASLSVAASAQTKSYGAADPSPLGYTASGYVNGDTATIFSGSLSRAAGEDVGSYAIDQGTLSAGANYSIDFTGANLTITPASLAVTATAQSKTYGASDPSPLGYSASGYVNGDTAAILTGSLTRAAGDSVGSYAIGQGTLSAGANYSIDFTGANLTITPASLAVTATAQSKSYGASDPSPLGYSASGYVNGDTAAILTGSLTRAAGESVGSYAIGQGTLSAGANYSIDFTGANLTITPASLTVTATAQSKTYGASDPSPLGYTASGYVNGDTAAILSGSLTRAAGENVGSYAIGQGTLSAGSNYSIAFTGSTLTINPASLTVTATAQTKTYGAADPSPLAYTASGYVTGDTVAIFSGSLTRAAGENVGTYAIGQGTLSAGSNYSIAFTGSTLTIIPASLAVTATAQTKTYGAADPSPLAYTASGYVNGDTSAIFSGSLTRAVGENVGSYAIGQGTLSAGSNYSIAFTGSTLTINPASLAVTATAQTKTYGAADPSPFGYNASGYVNGDTSAIFSGSLTRAAGENVGSYAIGQGTLSAGANYSIAFTGSTLTVIPASLTVTATAQSKIYGASDPSPLGYTASGYVNGDTAAIFSGSLTRVAGENVGSYAIGQGTLSAGSNYSIAFTGSTLTINPAALAVTATAQSKTYGASDPSPLGYTASGYVNGDTSAIFSGSLTRVAGENVGSYAIGQGTLSAGSNYSIAFTGSTLTINPASLTVTATAQTKTYGAADPSPLPYTASGYVNGDTAAILTGSLTRAAGEIVGSYAIGQGTLSAGANYSIAFTGATLNITPAFLTITATPCSKTYGAPDPTPLAYLASGYVNGETAAILTGSLTRAAGEIVGSYAIGEGTLSAGANYTVAFTGANLTITPAVLAISATAHSKTYGSPDPSPLAYTVSGYVNGDTAAILTGSLTRAAGETVGSYAIAQGTVSAGANYTIAFTGASLIIAQASLAVTATDHSKTYGSADPNALGYNVTGFLNGDTATILTGSLSRSPGENVGSYSIGQGTLSAGVNYAIAFVGATLTITPASLTVAASPHSKIYGSADANPLGYTVSGYVNGDTATILTGSLARSSGENVGNYAIGLGTLSAGTNYTIAFTGAALTITPAPLTITAENKERQRGTPNPELTAMYDGLASFDTIASLGGLPSLTTNADESSPAGNYPIIAALGTITSTNYTYSFIPGILTVTAGAQQTITFNPLRPKTFGDGDFDPGATASSGLSVAYTSSAPAIASVVDGKIRVLAPGSSDITASQAGNQQYEPAADVTRTLIVNPPPWNGLGFDGSDDRMQVQDAPQLNFANSTGFSIETWLRLDGSQPDGAGLVSKGEGGTPWSGYQLILLQNRIAAEIGDGTVTLGASDGLVGTSALNDGQWHHVALSVDRAQSTASLYLDGRLEAEVSNPALGLDPDNVSNLQLGVDRTATRFFKGRFDELRLWDSARSREEIRNAVSRIIDPQGEAHLVAYYHLDEGDVGLDNAAFTTAPERTAHGADGSLHGFALSGAESNWIASGAFIPLLETVPIGSVGSNAAMGGGTVYPNYYPATEVGLCWGTAPNPGLGDTCSQSGSGSGAYETAITGLTPGTTYHVRGFASNQMGTAYGNDITFQTARLPQSIDFGPLEDRIYGDSAFTLSGSASSGLTLTYTSSNPSVAVVVNGEVRMIGAGSTIITASQPGNATYSPAADVSRSFNVNKKALAVTADNKSRVYLGANPTLTANFVGFVPGEDAGVVSGAPDLSTTATPASPVGEYPIVVALGTLAAANYSFLLSNGTLTIRPAVQSIDFGPIAERSYGDGAFQAGGSATSGLPITYTSSNPAVAVVVDGEIRIVGAGSTVVTASQAGSQNYDPASDVPQPFTVRKQALTVTADHKTRVYLSANPTLTASYQGFVLGEDSTVISGTPDLSTTASLASPVGAYDIVVGLGTLAAQNYSFVLINGTLTVLPAAQSISFNPLRPKTFGDGDFDPGATASSGLPVAYASSAPAIASVVDGKIRVLAPGSTDITASQAGNQQYQLAAEVTRTLIVNPPPWNGLGLDGSDDRMQVQDAPQLNFGDKTGFSIETWLRLDGSQTDGAGLVSKGEGGTPWSGYQLILHQNRIAAEVGDGTVTFGAANGLIGTSTLNDGQWHHVALSVNRAQSTASLYLDGRLEAEVSSPALGLDPDNVSNLQLGVDRTGTRFFKGRIDELRLWDSARSREEIRNAVSQIIDPQGEARLVAYYHLDEGDVGLDNAAFTTAPERTAHGADGSLHGFALSGAESNWIASGAFIPLLETAPIGSVGSNAAMGGGTVYPNYYPATEVGLCWGTAPNPGLGDTCSSSGSGSGPFAGALTGLTAGVTYHVRAYATNQMGTAYGNNITFQAARLAQTINFAPLANRTYGDAAVTLSGSASSGLPLTYTSSNPAVAMVVNGEIRIRGAGSTVITASQPGNGTYSPAADVPRSFIVNRKALTVTADDKSRAYRTPNPTLTASYQGFVAGEDGAAISGTPTLSTAAGLESPVGSYDIVAGLGTLAAENYKFVLINGTLAVFQSCQEILFPPISDRTYGDPPFALIASACSGLTLSFTSSNPQVAQLNGNILTITGAGSSVISARQQGTGDLEPPPEVFRTLVVHKSGQELSFVPLGQKVLGDAPFTLSATASSALPVSYLSSDPEVASVSGNEVSMVGVGTTVITAVQEGNGNYHAALPASQPLTVVQEGIAPVLALSTLPSGAVTADPVLNIAGRASDASGIASLTVNGTDLTGRAALFSTAVPLSIGENSIAVIARDGAGNVTTQTIAVVLDATAPAIALAEPADNSVSDVPHFTASGSVAPGSAVTLGVNGAAPQSVPVNGGEFSASGYLEQGLNTIEVRATLSGRSSTVKRSLSYAPGKPAVAITEPAEDIRTERSVLTIRGTAGSSGAAGVLLDVGGTLFTPSLQNGTFQQEISLEQPGQLQVSATVTDSGGNLSRAHRNIVRIDTIGGDLNFDGLVDIRDAAALLRIALDMEPATTQALSHGDLAPLVNGVPQPDGRIDVGDVLVLLRKIVGLVD